MSLEHAINTPIGQYINHGFAATIHMPKTRITKDGKDFYVCTLADGAFRAEASSFRQDFAKYDNQRVHFSGQGMKRGDYYNGTAKITIGEKAVWKSLGAGDEAAEAHSEATQAFPETVTRPSRVIPYAKTAASAPRVEGMAVGNALTNATQLAIAGKIQSEALESFLFHTASKYLRTASKLLAGELSPSNILAPAKTVMYGESEEAPF